MFELPLFPLNTVLFPGMPLQLHVFEERYRLMMQRVLATNQTFGVNLIRNGTEALGPLPQPYEIGCTARVVSVEPAGNGRLNVTVVGDERYRILRMGSAMPYLTAFVESLPLDAHHTIEVVRGAHSLRLHVVRYLALLAQHLKPASPAQGANLADPASPEDPADPGDQLTPDQLRSLLDPGDPADTGGLQDLFDVSAETGNDEDEEVDLSTLQLPEDPLMLVYMAAALLQVPAMEKQPVLEVNTAVEMLRCVQRLYRRELTILPPIFAMSEEQARLSAWVN